FWMGMAMLFSVITKRPATSFLSSFALWLFFSIIISLVAQFTANGISPITEGSAETLIRNVELMQTVMRFSPNFLLQEASLVLLQPPTHGSLLLAALVAVEGNPLSLGQSLLLVWPHLTTLVGLTIVCFGISYVVFMRQEIRST
ncbi:MAG: ABC transporter permease subunit, partial [Chloroflexi bacterium]|nr:ABC transporter permease subunit [Chloroflexota bacterium]